METTTSTIISGISEDKIARIRRNLIKELEWIKIQELSERVNKSLLGLLRYFALKSTTKQYHVLSDLTLRFLETISDIKSRCNTDDLKEMFENIIPELTEWCSIIAITAENAPFLQTFFLLWSEIVSGTDSTIVGFTSLNKIPALCNICETIFKTGHYQTQLNGLELFLRYITPYEIKEKTKILKTIIPAPEFRRIRHLLCNFDNSNFEFDSRDFLNEFNMNISEEEPVYSIAVEKGYIGEKPIVKPMHGTKEYVFWVDFNSATGSVSFYCNSTTFVPNSIGWTNIEMKCPKKIAIGRKTCEFYIFANRDDIEVYSMSSRQIFAQPKLIFRFIFNEKDLSHLQKVISCYNFKKKTNNDASIYTECDRFYTGFKTVNTDTNHESRHIQTDKKKESLEKRKLPDSENKQIVPYKRVRTETTTEYNGGGSGDDILSNLKRKFHQFFTSAISDMRINSDAEEIKVRLFEQLSTFMKSCERHNLQSFESWKQIQKLLVQIDKEKERFHLESLAAFNQFSKAQKALAELRNTCKTKDAEKLVRLEKVRNGMKESVARIAKTEWQNYIDNLTSNIIKSIQRNIDLDLQL